MESEALKDKISQLDQERIPRHVAIIMDGNGRWAKSHAMQRSAGHYQGVGSVHEVTEIASDLGIDYLTLYAFSTENWNRPQEEVDILMHLIGVSIEREMPGMVKNNVHLRLIGDIERMPLEAKERLYRCVEATKDCDGLTMSLCLSYSSRWELTEAARQLATQVAQGLLSPEDITPERMAAHLATAGMPDPDLLIRTGGECRVSNYLLWQIAYAELYFTDILWPEFGKEQFVDALLDYQGRERRYGKTSEQVSSTPESPQDPN